jgi:hypothetical protein
VVNVSVRSEVADVVAAASDNAKGLVSSSKFAKRRKDAFEKLKRRPNVLWIE